MNLKYRIDDRDLRAGLRESARRARDDVRKASQRAIDKEVVPTANRMVPRFARGHIIGKTSPRSVYLTTNLSRAKSRGQPGQVIGLLEFGGTVKTPVKPKRRKALHFGGRFAASVTTPRHYRGHHYLARARDLRLRAFCSSVEEQLSGVIQSRIAYNRTFGGSR